MGCSNATTKENIIKERIKNTKKEIIKYEAKTSLIEDEISKKKKQLDATKHNPIKEEELKNDLFRAIKKYQRFFNHLRILKNIIEIMERQNEQNKFVNVLDKNNKAFKELNGDRNAEIINDNLNNIRIQNEQIELNDKLFDEINKIDNGPQSKSERDAFINQFFQNNSNHFN